MKLPPILILAGGKGTRVSHISGELPKCLIPINGIPFLQIQLQNLINNGFDEIIISTGYKYQEIKQFLQNSSTNIHNLKLVYDGPSPLGTGGAISNALPLLGKEFFVIYGDSFLEIDYRKFYSFCSPFEACMAIYKNKLSPEENNVTKIEDSRIFYKKEKLNSDFEFIDYGTTFFKAQLFDTANLPKSYDLSTLLNRISMENKLYGYEVKNRFYEIGSEKGIREFSEYLKARIY